MTWIERVDRFGDPISGWISDLAFAPSRWATGRGVVAKTVALLLFFPWAAATLPLILLISFPCMVVVFIAELWREMR